METTSSTSNGISSSNVSIVKDQRKPNRFQGIRIENPFTLKVGQVFTGFGIGCGIGIGVGRPINLGAVPMLNQVTSATRGATDAFSGVSRHVNDSLRKLGAKNIEAGVGCGVGFGHGFGVGMSRYTLKERNQCYCYSDLYMSSTKIVKLKGHSQGMFPLSNHSLVKLFSTREGK
ncbi:hypothetical protein SLA2020_380920 [Shorea laevis]